MGQNVCGGGGASASAPQARERLTGRERRAARPQGAPPDVRTVNEVNREQRAPGAVVFPQVFASEWLPATRPAGSREEARASKKWEFKKQDIEKVGL